ncbi:MAG TPA: protein kinase [Candidatus Limnocylindrales bacterium]|nr:protein kinase [Candidatus Limnocylindrales bacterium]
MDADRWRKIEDVFHAASALPPPDRAALLDRECAGDDEVRHTVERMLRQSAEGILDGDAWTAPTATMRPASHLAPQTRIGPYEIVSLLGAGGMGEVYRARDTRLNRSVAVKILPALSGEDAAQRRRLLREARAAAALNHPGIVTIHDVTSADGLDCIVMELVEGASLETLIGERGLPFPDALSYAVQIADALAAAHAQGIVHRDLKPANVIVNQATGKLKILDFGVAKLQRPPGASPQLAETVSSENVIAGTVPYMSPEQALGQRVDARSDIFSFGTVLYEMLTGRRPFTGVNQAGVYSAILRAEPRPPGQLIAAPLPRGLEAVVLRCLRKEPEHRFQTAAELKLALEDIARGGASRKRRWPLAVAAAAVVVAAAAVALFLSRRPAPLQPGSLTQITFDGGIAATPAISPDGKLLAFASDRAGAGSIDIWIRQLAGGGLIKLTSQPGVSYYPQFSADGTKLYYLTGGQSIVEMPSFGGPARTIVIDAGPFSLAANGEIIYTRLTPGYAPGPIMRTSTSGAPPREWQPACRSFPHPAISPDGTKIFFAGRCGTVANGFFLSESGPPSVLSVPAPAASAAFSGPAWYRLASGRQGVIYARQPALVRFERGGATDLLPSTDGLRWPAVSPDGIVIFSREQEPMGVWRLPLSARSSDAPAESLEEGIGHFAASRDGETLIYGRLTAGTSGELVVRNLETHQNRIFAAHDLLTASVGSLWPQMSPDGKQIVYRLVGKDGGHYLLTLATGEVKRIAAPDRLQLASDWSPDGKRILGECPPPNFGICELDPASGAVTTLAAHSSDQLLYPSWRWDGRAVVFMRRKPGGLTSIWAARVIDGKMAPESEWVEISPPMTDNARPRFGSDGATLYYFLGRAGQQVPAMQALDRATLRPAGDPIPLARTPAEITGISTAGPYPLIVVTRKGVIYSGKVTRGNLWQTRLN